MKPLEKDGYIYINRPAKDDIEWAINMSKPPALGEVAILRDSYLEAVSALREAVIEEETMLDDHGFLDPEHEAVLRDQVKQHNAILDKAPEVNNESK